MGHANRDPVTCTGFTIAVIKKAAIARAAGATAENAHGQLQGHASAAECAASLQAVRKKYLSSKYGAVATIPIRSA